MVVKTLGFLDNQGRMCWFYVTHLLRIAVTEYRFILMLDKLTGKCLQRRIAVHVTCFVLHT